jgi:hypothetical protein
MALVGKNGKLSLVCKNLKSAVRFTELCQRMTRTGGSQREGKMSQIGERLCKVARRSAQLLRVFFAASLLGAIPGAHSQQVWGEGNLATVLVGVDPASQSPLREKLMLIALGPDKVEPFELTRPFADCMRNSVVGLAESEATWGALDREISPWTSLAEDIKRAGQPVNASTIAAARAARVRQVAKAFADARGRFFAAMAKCKLPPALSAQGRLAIVNRVCHEHALRSCTGNDYLSNPSYLSASRYSKIFEWLVTAGVRRENDFLEIGPDAVLTPVVVANEMYPLKPWPAPRSAEQMQRAFEAGAIRMRASKAKYDYVAPKVIGLPKDAGYRLVDVIANPAFSVPGLVAAAPDAPALLSISDEIARSRITECVQLLARRDPASVGDCAGYTVDMAALGSCMNGGRCLPPMSAQGNASVLQHASVRAGLQLLGTSLPRVGNAAVSWEQYEGAAAQCKKKPPEQAAICMSRTALKATDQKAFDCASSVATTKGGAGAAAQCLADALPEGRQKELAKCAATNAKSPRKMAVCATLADAQPSVKAGVACMESYLKAGKKEATLSCLSNPDSKILGGDVAKAAACIDKHPNDWTAAAVCFEAGSTLPPGSDEAVACANTADDYKKFAGCMAATKLFGNSMGGDGGRLINCAAQSGGDGLTTMACMAGTSLTPEQQIALQCAAQSPDLITFAGCTGGQLSLREFMKCRGREFGDDVCFGPNNEVRKFLKAIGIDVRKETVLGQIGNAHLDVLKAQLAFAESAGKEIEKVGESLFQAVDAIGEATGNAVNGLVSAGKSVVEGIGRALGF